MHSPAQFTWPRLPSNEEGALTVMVFLCGLVSSLVCFRFDSLPAGAVDGAIVYAAAGGVSTVGCIYQAIRVDFSWCR
jgi:hypothetical protein